jgi:hypothetical protein
MANQPDPRKTRCNLLIWTDVYDTYVKRARIEKTTKTSLLKQAIYAKAEQYDPNLAAIISRLELQPSPNAASKMKRSRER